MKSFHGKKKSFQQYENNSKNSWKMVKKVLNWTQGGPPDKLFYKGGLKTKSFDIAEAQNQFFIDKVSQIKSDLPCPVTDPLAKLRSLMCNRNCTFV